MTPLDRRASGIEVISRVSEFDSTRRVSGVASMSAAVAQTVLCASPRLLIAALRLGGRYVGGERILRCRRPAGFIGSRLSYFRRNNS